MMKYNSIQTSHRARSKSKNNIRLKSPRETICSIIKKLGWKGHLFILDSNHVDSSHCARLTIKIKQGKKEAHFFSLQKAHTIKRKKQSVASKNNPTLCISSNLSSMDVFLHLLSKKMIIIL